MFWVCWLKNNHAILTITFLKKWWASTILSVNEIERTRAYLFLLEYLYSKFLFLFSSWVILELKSGKLIWKSNQKLRSWSLTTCTEARSWLKFCRTSKPVRRQHVSKHPSISQKCPQNWLIYFQGKWLDIFSYKSKRCEQCLWKLDGFKS